jgi:hypothetical protein
MVFNDGMRRGRVLSAALAGVVLIASSGCGREAEYQYLEVPDGATFAKLPADWTVDSEGWTDFAFADIGDLAILPDDTPIAWRAQFNGEFDGRLPLGEIQVQSVDARTRTGFLLGPLIGPVDGVEELSRVKVQVGELTGWRAVQERDRDGTTWVTEHLILTDDRRSTTYYVGIQCTEECYQQHRQEIDEVITTFTVES